MQFKACPSYPGYEVSEGGVVRTTHRSRRSAYPIGYVLSPYVEKDGRIGISITIAGKHRSIRVATLVADAWICPKPHPKLEVCHNDGDEANNHYKNLRWDTRANNQADKLLHGTHQRGARSPQAKLTPEQVAEIRASDEKQQVLADRYGVRQGHISRIKAGVRWLPDLHGNVNDASP
jgi:hypothetical protein